MKFPLYIAKRYLFSKSSTNAINIITMVSVASIIIGTMVLFVVLSAFSGLKDFNLDITSAIDPDLKVTPTLGKTFQFTDQSEAHIEKINGILAYSKIIEERAYLEFNGKTQLGYLKGVDEAYLQVNDFEKNIIYGAWPEIGEPQVAVGYGIARTLSLGVSDYRTLLKIMVPKPGTGQIMDPTEAFSASSGVVSGIFQAGESIDTDHLYANIDFVGSLLKYDITTISALEVKLKPEADEEKVRAALLAIFPNQALQIKNRIELNDALYKMLNTENLALYFICTLVLIIALFSFIGSIIMIILDKRKNIKTMLDLGATLRQIRTVFLLQGIFMILLGGAIGLSLGALLVILQQQLGFVMITPTLAYPIKFNIMNLLIVLGTILFLGGLASKLASSRINKKMMYD